MKLLIQIIAILVVISTICICALKPDMHKSVLVYDSDYKLVNEDDVQVETTQVPVMEMPVNRQIHTVKNNIEIVTMPKTQTTVQTVVKQPQTQNSNQNNKTILNTSSKTSPITVKTEKTVQPVTQTTSTQNPLQDAKIAQTNLQNIPKVLTNQEEEIAWNVWRSNLQNKIMQDVKMPVLPNGVVFRFSFNVDKYGKISNIYTSSDNPSFTPYAIQYIAPVIRSYQGKSILNFPEGSSRITTEFKGGWRISSNERLSTPQDYNDYEKVIKTSY